VADYSGTEYSAIIYGRGALFFEALREQMGLEAFDTFMREYVSTYTWGIATPEGLKSLAETNCDCDLTPLFDEWVNP
jgi:aminopeptidase N